MSPKPPTPVWFVLWVLFCLAMSVGIVGTLAWALIRITLWIVSK